MTNEYLKVYSEAMDKIMSHFNHDTALEQMRYRHDHAEKPEPQEPERGSEEWNLCVNITINEMDPEFWDEVGMEIIEHGCVSNRLKNKLNDRLDAELQKRAK